MNEHRPRKTFPPSVRLQKSSEFERVFQQRVRASDQYLLVYIANNDLNHPRLGIVAGRRFGNAVKRNRIKRLIREAFRQKQYYLPSVDCVVIPKPGIEPRLADLQDSLQKLLDQLANRLSKQK
jgi:ribonuclease P protein component